MVDVEKERARALARARAKAAQQGVDLPPIQQEQWEPGTILPVATNPETGEKRWFQDWPQMAQDVGNAVMAPGRALQGEYGMEVDPATGRPTTITNEMIGDTMGLAAMSPAGNVAAAGPRVAASVPRGFGAARRKVIEQLLKGDVQPENIGPQLRAIGDDAMVGDLTPGTQGMTQAIATHEGPGQRTVIDALTRRQSGSNARIQRDVDEALGPAPVPSQVQAGIRTNQQALSPEYEAVLGNAKRVDTSDLAGNLEALETNLRGRAQRAVGQVRDMLTLQGTDQLDPNPATLLETRKAIDGMLAGETDTNAVRALSEARKQVDDLLAEAAPGIKQVDARFGELARQSEGFDQGQRVLDSGRTAQRPSEVAASVAESAIPEGALVGPSGAAFRMREGARTEIDRIIGNNLNDKTALRRLLKGEGSWNRDRLASVFGQEKADQLLNVMEREMRFAETENPALHGSRTEVIRAANEALNPPQQSSGALEGTLNALNPVYLKPGTAIARGIDRATGGMATRSRDRRNAIIADMLTGRAGDEVTRMLAQRQMRSLPGAAGEIGSNAALRALIENRSGQTGPRTSRARALPGM